MKVILKETIDKSWRESIDKKIDHLEQQHEELKEGQIKLATIIKEK